jgi:plasmid stability protein
MGQMTIRKLDDALLTRLKARAKEERTSAEALAREAIHRAAESLSPAEKQALVRESWAKFEAAKIPGKTQTAGWKLIREDRDGDH